MASNPPQKSATFLGKAETMNSEDEKDSYYRKIHMKNCDIPQFILGEDINLIIFSIAEIIVSNSKDQVKYIGE